MNTIEDWAKHAGESDGQLIKTIEVLKELLRTCEFRTSVAYAAYKEGLKTIKEFNDAFQVGGENNG